MVFSKPYNMKYTEMAKWVDEHSKEISANGEYPAIEEKAFQYLYNIIYALAYKAKYFPKFEDYDGYSIYAAGEVYMSIKNSFINQGKVQRKKVVVPIKSCLNYIKSTMFPFKVDYVRRNYQEIMDPTYNSTIDVAAIENTIREDIQSNYYEGMDEALLDSFKLIPNLFKHAIWQTPYKKDKVMFKNLYISCLLSMINSITFPVELLKGIDSKIKSKKAIRSNFINKYYLKELDTCIILWHLPKGKGYEDLVRLLINKVKMEAGKDIKDIINYFELDNNTIDDIMSSTYSSFFGDDKGDTYAKEE